MSQIQETNPKSIPHEGFTVTFHSLYSYLPYNTDCSQVLSQLVLSRYPRNAGQIAGCFSTGAWGGEKQLGRTCENSSETAQGGGRRDKRGGWEGPEGRRTETPQLHSCCLVALVWTTNRKTCPRRCKGD